LEYETISGDRVEIKRKNGWKIVWCARVNAEEKVPPHAALETCPICLALKGKGIRECDFEIRNL